MGYDRKYGKIITERGDIPDDEPVIVFRAQDRIVPALINIYIELCDMAGSPAERTEFVTETYELFCAWQLDHPERVKTPESARVREWLRGAE